MYCSKCGAQLADDSRFCSACGAPCNPQQQTVQEAPVNQQTIPVPEVPANGYYEIQFARIAAGEKAKFNWAAFFLGPFHQLYHGSIKRFQKTYLPYMIAAAALYLVQMIATFTTSLTGTLMVTALAGILWLALSIWALVLAIGNGRKYNACLYEQTGGNAAAVPKRKKPVCVLIAAIVVYGILLTAVSAIGTRMMMESWMDNINDSMTQIPEEIDPWLDSSEPEENSTVQQDTPVSPWLLGPDENYWQGAWQETTSGQVTTFNRMTSGIIDLQDETVDENGYSVYVYSGGELERRIAVTPDGSQLTEYVPSYAGGMIAAAMYERPQEPTESSLPDEFWGIYQPVEGGFTARESMVLDAFRAGLYPYQVIGQQGEEWLIQTGGGIESEEYWVSMEEDGTLLARYNAPDSPTLLYEPLA